MTFKRLAFFFISIQIVEATVRWSKPTPARSSGRVEEPYYCNAGNMDKVLPENKQYTPRMVYWIENSTFEVHFTFNTDGARNENFTIVMHRVKWRQDMSNVTAYLPPIVDGPWQMIYAETVGVDQLMDSSGVMKPKDSGTIKLNITLGANHVCRPEDFACVLHLDQNRTGSFGASWKSCVDVLILSRGNDVDLAITMQTANNDPYLVAVVMQQLIAIYSTRGFTENNVKMVSPAPGTEVFTVSASGHYSVTYRISDMVGFNSETVAKTIEDTYATDTSLGITSIGFQQTTNGVAKSCQMGIFVTIGLVLLHFML